MTAKTASRNGRRPARLRPWPSGARVAGRVLRSIRRQNQEEAHVAHFVIMGCGRVGATLAHTLEDAGHSVAIIDQDDRAFRRLRAGFSGRKVTGVGL